jgi:hypothetical protein
MKRRVILPIAAVLIAGAVSPALAAWDRIGSVDFSRRDTHDAQYGNFGGSVEALALQARGSDLRCDSVTATFGNGRTRQVFRGNLPEGQNVTIDLPGRERRLSRLDFDCRPTERGRASVEIVADVGQYRDEWRRSPDWQRTWSRMFNWDNDRRDNRDGDRRYTR